MRPNLPNPQSSTSSLPFAAKDRVHDDQLSDKVDRSFSARFRRVGSKRRSVGFFTGSRLGGRPLSTLADYIALQGKRPLLTAVSGRCSLWSFSAIAKRRHQWQQNASHRTRQTLILAVVAVVDDFRVNA